MNMLWMLGDLITLSATVFLVYYLLKRKLGYQEKNRIIPATGAFILLGIIYALYFPGVFADLIGCVCVPLYAAYAYFAFEGSAAKRIVWGCAAALLVMIVYALTCILAAVLGFGDMARAAEPGNPRLYLTVVYLLLVTAVFVVIARGSAGRQEIRLDPVRTVCVAAATALSCLLLHEGIGRIAAGTDGAGSADAVKITLCLVGVLAAMLLFIVGYGQSRMREHRCAQEAERCRMENEYYRHNEISVKALRELRHDIETHMHVMKALVAQGKNDELLEYFDSIDKKYQKGKTVYLTDNTMLNAMLTSKLQAFNDENIEMNLNYNTEREIPLSYADYCSLIGNMLENAIEANRKISRREERFIDITVGDKGEMVFIKVENASDGEYLYRDGALSSTKSGTRHGLGLRRIKDIAESLGGFFDVNPGPDKFTAIVMLPPGRKEERSL